MVSAQIFRHRESKQQNRSYARAMRHVPTESERKLWFHLKGRGFGGYKFKRQVLIGSYIVDFVCIERRVIVELDGGQHADRKTYDRKRDAFLEAKGFRVLRFWNLDFMESADGVLSVLAEALDRSPSP